MHAAIPLPIKGAMTMASSKMDSEILYMRRKSSGKIIS
jgi:hypothetical protein